MSSTWSSQEAWEDRTSPIKEVVSFDEEHAKIAGDLIAQTRPVRLSLGDRACLALALASKAPVYAADRSWKSLKLKVGVHVIR